MMAPLLGLGALCAAGAGFTALGLAMDRHWGQLHGRGAQPGRRQRMLMRAAGTLGLVVALLACLAGWGQVQGWIAWAGVLTGAACATALTLTYAARGAARIAWQVALLALIALAALAAGAVA